MPTYDLVTPRLGLRNWSQQDAIAFHELCNDKEVMEHFPNLLSMQEVDSFVTRMQKHYSQRGYCYFAADHLETGECIGMIGLLYQDFKSEYTPNVDIGWRISKKYWNKGLATEGAKACLEAAGPIWNIDTIYSFASLANTGSIRVMDKIGLEQVGTFIHPKIKDHPSLRDCVVYKNT